jgi:hypothetical protein
MHVQAWHMCIFCTMPCNIHLLVVCGFVPTKMYTVWHCHVHWMVTKLQGLLKNAQAIPYQLPGNPFLCSPRAAHNVLPLLLACCHAALPAGLLRAAAQHMPQGVTFEILDISQIPVYNVSGMAT